MIDPKLAALLEQGGFDVLTTQAAKLAKTSRRRTRTN
jgi:hypothetical protein